MRYIKLLLILVLFVSIGFVVSAADTYVDDDAAGGWYDATHVHTVQEGIDNASAGATVYIWDGTYTENVIINKSLTIIGNGTGSTYVYNTASTLFDVDDVSSLNISNIYFYSDTTRRAIDVYNSSNVNISSCTFLNNTETIYIKYCDDISVYNNTIYRPKYEGVHIQGSFSDRTNNVTVINNYIYGENCSTSNFGFFFWYCDNLLAQGNDVRYIGSDSFMLEATNHSQILNNYVYQISSNSNAIGMYTSSNDTEIKNNTMYSRIPLESNDGTFTNTLVRDNYFNSYSSYYVSYFEDVINLSYVNNTCVNGHWTAVIYIASDAITSHDILIDECNISGGTVDGIDLWHVENVSINNTNIYDVGKKGIEIDTSNNVSISNTNIYPNLEGNQGSYDGIHAINSNNITFYNCNIAHCKDDGIEIDNADDITMTDCWIYDITDRGIDIDTYTNFNMINSTVNDTTDYGLMLHAGSNVLISHSNFINTDWLKFDGDHTNVTVKNCLIEDVEAFVISEDNANLYNVSNNIFDDTYFYVAWDLENSIFSHNDMNNLTQNVGIYIRDNTYNNLSIYNNTILNAKMLPLSIRTNNPVTNVSIYNNHIFNNGTSYSFNWMVELTGSIGTGTCLYNNTIKANDVTISGSDVSDFVGIHIDGMNNMQIYENNISGFRCGLYYWNAGYYTIVRNNYFYDNERGIKAYSGTHNTSVYNNTFYNHSVCALEYASDTNDIYSNRVCSNNSVTYFTLEDTQKDGGSIYEGVWGDGNYIYTACHSDGIRAYTFIGENFVLKDTNDDGGGYYYAIWDDGTYIYVASGSDGIRAYTFDGTSFTLKDTQDDGTWEYYDIWGDGTYIYTACMGDGIRAYTFDGTNFVLKDTQDDGESYYGVWGDGTYIYAACGDAGIRAYTFDGSDFVLKDTQYDSDGCGDVWGDGTYIYTVCDTDGVQAYTFNGTNFVLKDTQYDGSYYQNVWVGAYIYTACDNGIRAYIFNGTSFTLKATQDDGGYYESIWDDGTYIYTACPNSGIRAYTIENDVGIKVSGDDNIIYNNYFNNTNNVIDSGTNTWNITKILGINIVGGPYLGGNYWSNYLGVDLDGDWLGDTLLPYNNSGSTIDVGGDYHPLIIPSDLDCWFTYTPTLPDVDEEIFFEDKSTGTILSWNWDWDDDTSDGQHKDEYHTYSEADVYYVTLNISNGVNYGQCRRAVSVGLPDVFIPKLQPPLYAGFTVPEMYHLMHVDRLYSSDAEIVIMYIDSGTTQRMYKSTDLSKIQALFHPSTIDPWDDYGHGTFVGYEIQYIVQEKLPKTKVISYRIFGDGPYTESDVFIDALEQAKQIKPDILSISAGTIGNPSDIFCRKVSELRSMGVIVICAAGNYGPASSSIISPGCGDSALAIGGEDPQWHYNEDIRRQRIEDLRDDRICIWSSRGPVPDVSQKPDVAAPGESIIGPWCNAEVVKSGTSMSAPLVSGGAAVVLANNKGLVDFNRILYFWWGGLVPNSFENALKESCYHKDNANNWGAGIPQFDDLNGAFFWKMLFWAVLPFIIIGLVIVGYLIYRRKDESGSKRKNKPKHAITKVFYNA